MDQTAQNRRPGRPRIYINDAERQRSHRLRETSQQRSIRWQANAEQQRRRRQNENEEQRLVRRSANAALQENRRQSEDVEERFARQMANADRQQRRRQSENDGQRSARLLENSQRQQRRRQSEDDEQRSARLLGNSQRQQRRRQGENDEQRSARLLEDSQRQQRRRQSENDEQRRKRKTHEDPTESPLKEAHDLRCEENIGNVQVTSEIDECHSSANESDGEDQSTNLESKQRKSGVLYFSRIPPKFTPSRLQEYFEKHAPRMIGRVHCTRNKNAKTIENRFSEGWLEVKRKKVAKMLASRFDNTPVGGKKREYASSVLWNIKYLSSFKWVHLMEQLQYERAVSAHHMSAEIAQAKRVAAHFEEQVEKGRNLRKLEEKALKANGTWNKFQREIEQRKVLKSKRKRFKSSHAHSAAKDDDVLQMIFAE